MADEVSTNPDDRTDEQKTDDGIVAEAKKRFERCQKWESYSRKLWLDDYKFCNADSDNKYQWPDSITVNRQNWDTPCLTVNKTQQHCRQIINDGKQNKPGINVKPTGNGSTTKSAELFEGVIRHIEYTSNAQVAYDTASEFQVVSGLGYWRVVTDFAGDDSFDQEIFIRRIKDPLSVYLDPDIKEKDGSDARFGFVFDDMPVDEFKSAYPKYKDMVRTSALSNDDGWGDENHVRVAEYFRKVKKSDRLIAMTDPETGTVTVRRSSEIPKALLKQIIDDPSSKMRDVVEDEIEWYLIIADEVAEKSIWPGKYVPIVRVIGEETVIDGQMDRKGHTRAMKDPQRIYNYWTSSAVEHVALQSKIPYIGSMDAFDGLETYWDNANNSNAAWLPFNGLDDKGQRIEKPERQQPPVMSQAYITGMQISSQEIQDVSGQFEAEMGMPSNEKSGVAIQQRQRKGDNATYHFIDNLAVAIRFTGKILIDLIPKIYDTPRVVRIMADDGAETEVQVDPKATEAFLEQQSQNADAARAIFNPNVGRYDVEADIGPAYATRRQEEFVALTQMAQQNEEVMKIGGDLIFKAADFSGSQTLAERWKRTIPSNILEDAPPPELMQMQQHLQTMQQQLVAALGALAEAKKKDGFEAQQKSIDAYKAETDREKVYLDHGVDMSQFKMDLAKLVLDLMKTDPNAPPQQVADQAASDQSAQSPAPQPMQQPQGMAA